MSMRSSAGIILGLFLLLNLGMTAFIYQELTDQASPQPNQTLELNELREQVNNLTLRVDRLTEFIESKHGRIPSLEIVDPAKRLRLFEQNMVKIGVITSTTVSYEAYVPYVKELIEKDINEYARSVGSELEFRFEIDDAQGQAARHLEILQEMYADGVGLVIGGMWSSQAGASRSYCDYSDIILFSPSSTSPLLALEDNLFRLAPTDVKQASAISRMLESQGIKAVIVIQRGDSWADHIYDLFEPEFTENGGVILERIRYAGEATEFSSYLQKAEEIAKNAIAEHGKEHVGIEIISFAEAVDMIRQSKDYPTLYNLPWYGSDGTASLQQIIDDVPEEAGHIKLFSPKSEATDTKEYLELSDRFWNHTGQELDFYTACSYDIAMIFAKSVIESNTIDSETLKSSILEVSNGYHGVTGICSLDDLGEREAASYGIYTYGIMEGEYGCWKVGFISDSGKVTWYDPR